MEYPIKLPPLAVIKAKALAALEAGELQCQQREFVRRKGCSYTGPCAIGVALPEEVRTFLEDECGGGRVAIFIASGRLLAEPDEVEALQAIQNAHDDKKIDRLRELLTA